MARERRSWSEQELLIVFRLYCRTPFGRLHHRNPDIIETARLIGRTPSAVAMKACNFASLDPNQQARDINALGNVSKADRELWESFSMDPGTIAQEAEAAYAAVTGFDQEDRLPEIETPIGPTDRESLVMTRRVQSFFRAAVLASYEFRCALTGLAVPELLNASHIIPWSVDRKRRADPRNGICLNVLHDRAFDRGLISFDDGLRVVLSPRITKGDQNKFYRDFLNNIAGHPLKLPKRFYPLREAIEFHRTNVFRA